MFIPKSTVVRHSSSLEAAVPNTKTSTDPLPRDDDNCCAVLIICMTVSIESSPQ